MREDGRQSSVVSRALHLKVDKFWPDLRNLGVQGHVREFLSDDVSTQRDDVSHTRLASTETRDQLIGLTSRNGTAEVLRIFF